MFNIYRPLGDDRHETHICWRFDGNSWIRNDGATLTRSSAISGWEFYSKIHNGTEPVLISWRSVGSMDDSNALGWADQKYPCPIPPPMAGQVWAAEDLNSGSYAEIIILGAIRQPGGFLLPIYKDGLRSNGSWPPPTMTLVDGPGSPWRAPLKEEEKSNAK